MGLIDRIDAKLAFRRRQRRGVEETDDRALGWMALATAGLLHPGQFALIERAIDELPSDDAVIEIGSFAGLSTNAILRALSVRNRANPVFTTDPWDFERATDERESIPETGIPIEALHAHVRAQFIENVRFWNGARLPHTLDLHSDEFFRAWLAREEHIDVFGRSAQLGGSVAFVFLDGNHSDAQARRDFENVDRILVPGGLLLLDDSDRFGAFPHLYGLAREICEQGYDLVAENPHHLLRKPA